jgi:hypothetical protein
VCVCACVFVIPHYLVLYPPQPEWFSPRSPLELPAEASLPALVSKDLRRVIALAAHMDDAAGVAESDSLASLFAAMERSGLSELQVR